MNIDTLSIPGVFLISPMIRTDVRGMLQKTFDARLFTEYGMDITIREQFDTQSRKNVIRGMHFQTPPHACAKYVSVSEGSILDVVLDLRAESPTFQKHLFVVLSARDKKTLYIPDGCAHGFKALTDWAHTHYLQTAGFDAVCDAGVRFDSFSMDWGVTNPIMSERDIALPALSSFISPFQYKE